MTKDIARSVEYYEFARDVWNELEERYGKVDAARVFELKKELAHISRGSLDIASYSNKIKKLWDEIASLSTTRVKSCMCGASSEYQKDDDVQMVYQFLMGLNDTYVQTRSNILALKPFSSVGTVYRVPYEQNKSSLLCKYCKKPGHTIDKCYKLHGYPSNFKFTKSAPTRKTIAHVKLDTNGTSDPGAQSFGYGFEICSNSHLYMGLPKISILN
ncbi:uncharacterized protein LOC132643902 [Lycium barbarum]|uniref:uncharacterized protein LOC132643902 n=1 Tax=Lycium barbarum TaxID=112863 RepID=UPI00293F61D9|nr:uncharacterized protein LOC132643902 [Lycium barbarum]